LDINDNPNSATNSTPQLTMPVALENAGRFSQTNFPDFGMWMGYVAINGGFALGYQANSYDITTNFMDNVWNNVYLNIANFRYIEQKAEEQNLPLYGAIARLFEAYDYSVLVDLYNNVPYSDAMLKNGTLNISPKYDKGSDIYDSCVAKIDKAIEILNDPATALTISKATDNVRIITFKGSLPDLTLWKKFANSLKLRLLLNQSEAGKDSYIKAEAAKIDTKYLLAVGDDVLADPGYLNSSGKLSPYYGSFYDNPGEAGDFYTMYTAPSVIMTAAEALFDQAEAIQRGWISGDAKQAYLDGIKSSFKYTNEDAKYDAYIAQSNDDVDWDAAKDKIKLIITQKWAALNQMSNLTVYNDYRRTGYPVVPISKYSGHKPKVPVRILYPQSEYNKNAKNVEAEGSIDPQTSKVFWDK
jgi:hypothetical protein